MTGIRIGTAGWSVPSAYRSDFPEEGSHLERYARRLDAVEINSSFYRPHRHATYRRWAASVPEDFRFSVKIPRTISHERRLAECGDLLARFADEVGGLEGKLGILLLQLPPSLAFDATVAAAFLSQCRSLIAAPIVCEPRHASWFTPDAEQLLAGHRVARVAADPPPVAGASEPGGWPGLVYYRLHGSPVIYRSAYGRARLAGYAARLRGLSGWCILDNTAAMAALGDALALRDMLPSVPERRVASIV